MSCVDETKAEKIAKRKALGRLSSLRRSIKSFKIKIGDDWLFGFVKTNVKNDKFSIFVKLVYIDCRGEALEKLPQTLVEKITQYVEEGSAATLQRELSEVVK